MTCENLALVEDQTKAKAGPSTYHPRTEKRSGPLSLRMTPSTFVKSRLNFSLLLYGFLFARSCWAQQVTPATPIAIVPVDSSTTVTGALEITAGKAMIGASGTMTSGSKTTEVVLPHRGVLRVCASTTVKLASDTSVPAGDTPGLVMGLDRGAIEASFATGKNADVVLTPDFRILISEAGPGNSGSSELKVRLGEHGDTCVDNAGSNAPYVLVSSVFDGGAYRVQPGQRVMFQHGSIREVVDQEQEPCGCPPEPKPGANEFPLAESAGLGAAPPVATAPQGTQEKAPDPATVPMEYHAEPAAQTTAPSAPEAAQPAAPASTAQSQPAPKKQQGFFAKLGGFFRKLFGAE